MVFAIASDTQPPAMYVSDSGSEFREPRDGRRSALRTLEQFAELDPLCVGCPLSRFGHPRTACQTKLRRCADLRGDDQVRKRTCGERMAPA